MNSDVSAATTTPSASAPSLSLVGIQDIEPLPRPGHWPCAFTLQGQSFLAVPDSVGDRGQRGLSQLYSWNGGAYEPFQSFPTYGGNHSSFFEIDGHAFLTWADQSEFSQTSHIYRWNGEEFEAFQEFGGGWCTSAFQHVPIAGEHYLAVANRAKYHHQFKTTSLIYKWDGARFVRFQDIVTNNIYGLSHAGVAGAHYLFMGNYGPSGNEPSEMLVWEPESSRFVHVQHMPTAPFFGEIAFFSAGEEACAGLAVGDRSRVYRRDAETGGFTEYTTLDTPLIGAWEVQGVELLVGSSAATSANWNSDASASRTRFLYWTGSEFADVAASGLEGLGLPRCVARTADGIHLVSLAPPLVRVFSLELSLPYKEVRIVVRARINLERPGLLPVTIIGTEDIDLGRIVRSTLRLNGVPVCGPGDQSEADDDVGLPGTAEGDRASLTVQFSMQDLASTLGTVSDGDSVEVILTGALENGDLIRGTDTVTVAQGSGS